MKARRLKFDQNVKNIVWFGSYGKNPDGTAKFYNSNNKHDNYSIEAEGVKDSLIQRLSVLKGELWYNVSVGIPLLEKYRTKGMIDAYIASVILKHPDVENIISFTSNQENHQYSCKFTCSTQYGNLTISI